MHYGFYQKEQDFNSNGNYCSFIICIRKSRDNTSNGESNVKIKVERLITINFHEYINSINTTFKLLQ